MSESILKGNRKTIQKGDFGAIHASLSLKGNQIKISEPGVDGGGNTADGDACTATFFFQKTP